MRFASTADGLSRARNRGVSPRRVSAGRTERKAFPRYPEISVQSRSSPTPVSSHTELHFWEPCEKAQRNHRGTEGTEAAQRAA